MPESRFVAKVGVEEIYIEVRGIPLPTGPIDRRLIDVMDSDNAIPPLLLLDRPTARGRYEILRGVREWRAAQELDRRELAAVVVTRCSPETVRVLIELDRGTMPPSPIRLATEIDDWRRRSGLPMAEVASRFGMTRTWAAHYVRLLRLEPSVQGLVADGRLGVGQAKALVTLKAADQRRWARDAINRKLSARTLERAVNRRVKRATKPATERRQDEPLTDADSRRLAAELGDLTGLPVTLTAKTIAFNHGGETEVMQGLLERLGWRQEHW